MTTEGTTTVRTSEEVLADYTGVEELAVQPDPEHAALARQVRELISERQLGATSARTTVVHLVLAWGGAIGAGIVGVVVNERAVWVVVWLAIAAVFAGNATLNHEAAHGHLFASRRWNKVVGTVALLPILGSYATYRCFHLEHHARTAREGDPERTPLNFPSRLLYVAALVLGGALVIVENTSYTVMTVLGHPPKWVRTARQRRAIRLNALYLLGVVALIVVGLVFDTSVVINVWLIPYVIGVCVYLPLFLLPEHYGATGEGDILDNTRNVASNALVRWVFWNNNFHAAHHLAPVVPFDKLAQVDRLLEAAGTVAPIWRLRSYTQFHWGTLTHLAFNRPRGEKTGSPEPSAASPA